MSPPSPDTSSPPMARPGLRRVFLRDMLLAARIGVHAHEQRGAQRIRVNIDLAVAEGVVGRDDLSDVVDYERVAVAVRAIVAAGHVRLVETLAERIAAACLEDARVRWTRVRVEKLDVFPDAESAGVEIVRDRSTALSTISV